MNGLGLSVLGAVLMAGGLATLAVHQSAQTRLRQKREIGREQAAELARWSAENARLSNLVEQAKCASSLSKDEARELLKLRNQVGNYGRNATETEALRTTNQRLEAEVSGILAKSNYWSGAQLAYHGFADPEAAMKSTLWAWIHGDDEAFLASLTPADRAGLAKQWEGKSQAGMAAQSRILARLYQPATEGVRVLDRRVLSPDEAVLELYFEGDGKRRQFELKKFGEEWRVTGLRAIFN